MEIEIIKKEIETFFEINKTEEYKMYSFADIFGHKYESKKLHEVIGVKISEIELKERTIYLGIWNNYDGLFYINKK